MAAALADKVSSQYLEQSLTEMKELMRLPGIKAISQMAADLLTSSSVSDPESVLAGL